MLFIKGFILNGVELCNLCDEGRNEDKGSLGIGMIGMEMGIELCKNDEFWVLRFSGVFKFWVYENFWGIYLKSVNLGSKNSGTAGFISFIWEMFTLLESGL